MNSAATMEGTPAITSTMNVVARASAAAAVLDQVHRRHQPERHGQHGGHPGLHQRPVERVINPAGELLGQHTLLRMGPPPRPCDGRTSLFR